VCLRLVLNHVNEHCKYVHMLSVVYSLIPPPQWPESASELYRPSDCRLLAKLVPTFADRGYSRISITIIILDIIHRPVF
jgi:hypothetical protein